jgi:Ca-activated chloride channel family protein
MKFVRIEMLFLIWTVPVCFLILFFGMKRRGKILSRFASKRGLAAIAPDADAKRRWIRAGLILLSMILITIALSGPQYGYKWETIERKGIDIMVALDCSKSMLAKDISPSRLERAKREIYDLLDMLQGDRIGLVAFAGTAFLQCPLTLDYHAFHIFLKALSPDSMPVGGTDIPGAVNTAISGFQKKDASTKAVILITDGESTTGDPIQAARLAQKDGIKLFCIGVGGKEGVPVPDEHGGFKKDSAGNIVLTRLDEETLTKMAHITGGTYVRSIAGDMDLETIYKKEIRGEMELTTLSSSRKQVWEDRYQWFLVPAILALFMELFLSERKKMIVLLLMASLLVSHVPAQAAGTKSTILQGTDAYEKKDYQKALKLFIDAQLENPSMPEIYYNIGNAYYKIGKFDAAGQHYKQSLKSKNSKLREKSLYNMGNAAYRMGKYEDAVSHYEAALKIDPDDTQARQNLDFVKKMIEQKKKRSDQPDKRDNHQHGIKNDAQKERADKESESSDKTDAKTENSGSQKPSEKAGSSPLSAHKNKKRSDQALTANTMSEKKTASKDSPNTTTVTKPFTDHKGEHHSDNMLNRLEDLPGRAMMPFYHEKEIEKDW